MSVSDSTRKEMEAALGADVATQIINDAEARGKALESTSRYKADETTDPRLDALTVAVKELAAQVTEIKALIPSAPAAAPATAPAQGSAPAPVPPSSSNQTTQGQDTLSGLMGEIKALNQKMETYMQLQPRGSQNPATALNLQNPTDAQVAAFLQQKEQETTRGKSLVQRAVALGMGVPQDTV